MLVVVVGCHSQTNLQTGTDAMFSAVPFDRWIAAGEKAQIKWEARVSVRGLSSTQRLVARAEIQIDGDEVSKRRGRGALLMLVQYTDAQGHVYRTYNLLDLRGVDHDTNKLNFIYSLDAYIQPGDYQVALALADSATRDYSAAQRMLRVNPFKNDPLPHLWDGLPPVQFMGEPGRDGRQDTGPRDPSNAQDNTEVNVLSEINTSAMRGRLNLPLETYRPVQLHVLVNTSPSLDEPGPRARPIPANMTLSRVMGALEVLAQISVRNGTSEIELLDLSRHRMIYGVNGKQPLDWDAVRAALNSADPKVIDAGSLRNRGQSARYFVEQVRKRIPTKEAALEAANEPPRVLIVLSAPMSFDRGEDKSPIEGGMAPNSKMYYIRQHVMPPRTPAALVEDSRYPRRPSAFPPIVPARTVYQESVDELLGTVKAVKPRVFDVYTPEDFRKALAAILEEVGRM
jgi:hypothetical protein